jgi:asparagine synthase (glutamine-hydrolysing)
MATSSWSSEELLVLTCGYPELECFASETQALSSSPTDAAAIASAWKKEGVNVLDQIVGNFALLVFEPRLGKLHLQVDQFGVVPLFVRITSHAVLASTESSPLLTVSPPVTLDRNALPDVFASRYLATAQGLWNGVRQVIPGRRCIIDTEGAVHEAIARRFSFGKPESSLRAQSSVHTLQHALTENLGRLRDQGVSDVVIPLSGGIDSSLVAALAGKVFPRCTAVTFQIDDFSNPELARSRQVADRLGMPLHIVPVSAHDVARLYPWVIERIQEPPRHYNNVVVARMLEDIREIAPVILSGDNATIYGAATIDRVRRQLSRQRRIAWLSQPLRQVAAALLNASGQPRLKRAAELFVASVPELVQRSRTLEITTEAAGALPENARSARPSAACIAHLWDDQLSIEDAAVMWTFREIEQPIFRRNTRLALPLDLRYHYPLQDVAALNLAAQLPPELKWDPVRREGKPLLRALCSSLVGDDVCAWPKFGFPTPELAWMEGPLADYFAASLRDDAPVAQYVNVNALRELPRSTNQQTFWTVMTLNDVLKQGIALMAH